jgi:hypothetical protein
MRRREQLVYLLCFIDPATGQPARYQHAGHYLGTSATERLAQHLEEHRQGRAAVLTAAARAAGLDFKITRTWPGGHRKERQLKTRSGALYCPDCSPRPQPGTTPPRPEAQYLTRRQREARAQDARAAGGQRPGRLSLYELDRLGTTCDGTPLPVVTTYPSPAAAPDQAATREEDAMFGRQKRAAARAEAARQAQADALFAEADRWADLAGEPPDFRQQITRERAARIMQQLGEPVTPGARASAPQPVLSGTERDAEIDRLAELFPEPEACRPGTAPGPLPQTFQPAASPTLAPVAATLPDGTPHADPFLAGRGWQARGGIYVRQPQPQIEAG